MTGQHPRDIINDAAMHWRQVAAVAITVGLNALDGFDVLSISFASPGIAREWGIDKAALGFVLSMELLGMAIGSIGLGAVADRIGRRPTILGCLVLMAAGMWGASAAASIPRLLAWRLVTGLGIGGMLAAINAVAAEFSNDKWRKFAMALMVIGYPLGAVIGGSVAAGLLKGGEWRGVFEFGAIVSAAFIPLVWLLIPESIALLEHKRPPGALERINATLSRFGHPAIDVLPPVPEARGRQSLADIFKPGLAGITTLVTLAYFAHITTFYFILKWVPKIVTDMGFEPSAAAGVLVWANVGGALGGAIFGLLAQRTGLKPLTIVTLLASSIMVVWFGRGQDGLTQLATIAGIAGFFTNAAVVGLYTLFAEAFPTHVRATGTGFAIGMGRAGSWLSPIAAGALFQAGYGLQSVAMLMALGSLIAAIALWRLVLHSPSNG